MFLQSKCRLLESAYSQRVRAPLMHFPALSTEAPVSSVSMVLAWVSNTQCRLEFSAPESLARDVVIRSPWRMTMWRSLLARALFCDEAMRAVCQSHCPQIGGARSPGREIGRTRLNSSQ